MREGGEEEAFSGLSLFSLVAGLRYLKTNFGSPGWMGNEASSVRIHAALSAEDLKGLRGGFPGGGNGPPPRGLGFEPWVSCWHPDDRAQLERILRERRGPAPGAAGGTGAAAQQQEGISFYAYQELAGKKEKKRWSIRFPT